MASSLTTRLLGPSGIEVSAVGLGTWAIGGLHWGGTDEAASRAAIVAAVENGINLIDTAPIYGFGRSEEIVGRTLHETGLRDQVVLATKCGLNWTENKHQVWRDSSPEWIRKEINMSLRRLQTDVIDLYQIHWPDNQTPLADTIQTLMELKQQGKIRAIGVSNFSVEQMQRCLSVGAIHEAPALDASQPPYNLFERAAETDILPFCHEEQIGVLAYGALCRGLLSGRITKDTAFPVGDLRRADPKFKADRRPQYLKAVARFKKIAEEKGCTVGQLAIAWTSQQKGVTTALVGARDGDQAIENAGALEVQLTQEELDQIDRILDREIKTPVGPDFFAPPL